MISLLIYKFKKRLFLRVIKERYNKNRLDIKCETCEQLMNLYIEQYKRTQKYIETVMEEYINDGLEGITEEYVLIPYQKEMEWIKDSFKHDLKQYSNDALMYRVCAHRGWITEKHLAEHFYNVYRNGRLFYDEHLKDFDVNLMTKKLKMRIKKKSLEKDFK
ncbi:MAG: hypothetical protein J6T10_12110 [Methanobrevibacter sp.]|nr:hypothetical protein [Methanobrevibacter sp.]